MYVYIYIHLNNRDNRMCEMEEILFRKPHEN